MIQGDAPGRLPVNTSQHKCLLIIFRRMYFQLNVFPIKDMYVESFTHPSNSCQGNDPDHLCQNY